METIDSKNFTKNAVEAAIKIAILGVLIVWTFQLIKPFIIPVIWGIILAVATEPFVARVAKIMGGRRALVSALFVLLVLVILVVPMFFMVTSSIDAGWALTEQIQNKTLVIPPPPAKVAEWPIIGESMRPKCDSALMD